MFKITLSDGSTIHTEKYDVVNLSKDSENVLITRTTYRAIIEALKKAGARGTGALLISGWEGCSITLALEIFDGKHNL